MGDKAKHRGEGNPRDFEGTRGGRDMGVDSIGDRSYEKGDCGVLSAAALKLGSTGISRQ